MKKVQLTPAQVASLIYAINLNLDYLEGEDGVKIQVNTLLRALEKLGGERANC